MELTKQILGDEVLDPVQKVGEIDAFISEHVDLYSPFTQRFESRNQSSLDLLGNGRVNTIINYNRINDFRYINKFFEAINRKLDAGDLYIGCIETKAARKMRVLSKLPVPFNYMLYATDFTYKRVIPKLPLIKKAYFAITQGHNRVLSLTEAIGRLVCCGFEVVETRKIGYLTWFVARKVAKPSYDMSATYGAVVKLRRIGYKGRLIGVYKLRTMHPYSEYIQEYMYRSNQLKPGGKIDDDVRITSWGRLMRKLWIDELPMLYNWLKRDVKLVGVRPLSRHYYNLYPEDLQKLRIQFRPGLIPPFYCDLPQTLEEIVESERRYLQAYEKNPFRTDIKYFFRSLYNILVKKARSA